MTSVVELLIFTKKSLYSSKKAYILDGINRSYSIPMNGKVKVGLCVFPSNLLPDLFFLYHDLVATAGVPDLPHAKNLQNQINK